MAKRLAARFVGEIEKLPETYSWAIRVDIEALRQVVEKCWDLPLVAVGSGGSLSVAGFAAQLHRAVASGIGFTVTPLEAVDGLGRIRDAALLFISAQGGNRDIVGAFRRLILREPRHTAVLTGRHDTPLGRLAARYQFASACEFDFPVKKDGFLATNSLLAFALLLYRTYCTIGQGCLCLPPLPDSIDGLLASSGTSSEVLTAIKSEVAPLWGRQTLLVLHGPGTRHAAADLESKFSETGLIPVLVSDYRNFAHGRHFWLAKRNRESAVLAIVSNGDKELASRTLELLPSDVLVARVQVPSDGVLAAISAQLLVLHLTAMAAEDLDINPSRPGVPVWGRKLYHLTAFPASGAGCRAAANKEIAVARKAHAVLNFGGVHSSSINRWTSNYEAYSGRLRKAKFGAVVFDYDGTLCPFESRFDGIAGSALAEHVIRILEGGISIGIATGRGRSVRDDLQDWVPKEYWRRVIVGYYNGADVGSLDQQKYPDSSGVPVPELLPFLDELKRQGLSRELCGLTIRSHQLTLTPHSFRFLPIIYELAFEITLKLPDPRPSCVCSTHSVDVVAPGVSKRALVDTVHESLRHLQLEVLCIGDQGRWPGNDYALLTWPYSLSVDTVSSRPESCWNLAPPGIRGVGATEWYLKRLRVRRGVAKLSLD
jgi:hypothetical protein